MEIPHSHAQVYLIFGCIAWSSLQLSTTYYAPTMAWPGLPPAKRTVQGYSSLSHSSFRDAFRFPSVLGSQYDISMSPIGLCSILSFAEVTVEHDCS
ncbi:hypothetical protein ASPSYDRAFT_1009205 [Aspergillus sydowii CBS 593.65]|uniref:Uncharacterized protein n=1 Tax=Aspergillus sydowii CBS 593.65 TaxID=1036612 RepID=A0A1L9TEX2_9EURO|nr:uncharacterized protein ASPSYDRAFT_1009205 [Aspergillus sydowii CBS 593.65]OJJ57843.1 hypothetical protein ASPSYDRAFT_1009205 [Aspergillus sydowii CBS 593.65]